MAPRPHAKQGAIGLALDWGSIPPLSDITPGVVSWQGQLAGVQAS